LSGYLAPADVVWKKAVEELEAEQAAFDNEALTLAEAERESPYTADWLGKLIKQGKLPNAGRKNAPRVLRRHLREYALTGAVTLEKKPAPVGGDSPSPSPPRSASLDECRSQAVHSRARRG